MQLSDLKNLDNFFLTGIGTDVGKTVTSAVLCNKLDLNYWKPVQAGGEDDSDTNFISKVLDKKQIIPEGIYLNTPCSPHEAAEIDGVFVDIDNYPPPKTNKTLLIEGAGGLMVPINNKGVTYIDYVKKYSLPTVLVIRHYLGSINHSMLSIKTILDENIELLGIIYSGKENAQSEKIIATKFPEVKVLLRIPEFENNLVEEIKNF
jgi:dethiobiotin synthetase